jgi:hypothetical protein
MNGVVFERAIVRNIRIAPARALPMYNHDQQRENGMRIWFRWIILGMCMWLITVMVIIATAFEDAIFLK